MKHITVYFIILVAALLFTGCAEKSYQIVFEELNTGSDASIRALHVVDENVVWASGSGGTFLLTRDGGQTWLVDTVQGASGDDFRNIHAWNDTEAILFGIGKAGRAYYTDDAGKSWIPVYENNTNGIFFNSLVFADVMNGLALSDPIDNTPFLIITEDGGKTWKPVASMPRVMDGEYNFAASNSCVDYHPSGHICIITGGTAARAIVSFDNGETWQVSETGLVNGNPSSGNFSVSFYDDRNGIVVGGTYDNPSLNENIAAWSSDGGKNWNLSVIMPREYRSSVIWMGKGRRRLAFAIGKTGCDYSIDYGHTWLAGTDDKDYYTARAIPGTLSGFAAGADGKIARIKVELLKR